MDTTVILPLVKSRLAITINSRDTYLKAIIDGILKELKDQQGITLDPEDQSHVMFVVDYSVWRYQSRDVNAGLPRHLSFRLKNLFVSAGGKTNV